DLWDPTAFPAWAYKEELAKSQQNVTSRKEDENAGTQRDCVEFVPATNQGRSGFEGTPAMISRSKASTSSAAERVAAGPERDGSRASQAANGRFRRDLERRRDRKGN
ncbi:MAG: hypothetical protein L6R42_010095, partial [Xanthoria sp. 1 TBL-2021]